jgi:hypothetical protein
MLNTGDEDKIGHAAKLIVNMIVMSHKFDNELSHEKGVGKVFDTVRDCPLSLM